MRKYTLLLILFLAALGLGAQEQLSITGVDSSQILVTGRVHIYTAVNDRDLEASEGLPGFEDFILEEYDPATGIWSEGAIREVQYNGVNQDQISMSLLIDNSGSMYDTIAGVPAESDEEQRMWFVKKALQDLLEGTRDYEDNLSLVGFNTNVDTMTPFTSNRNQLLEGLESIARPSGSEGYTELYRAMQLAADDLSLRKGRKVLVLLSDGENYTYAENRKEPHPVWGNELIELEELEDLMQKRGITLYTILYARTPDPDLEALSTVSGGRTYAASSRKDLLDAYSEIHDRINREFRVSYEPGMSSGRERIVKVSIADYGSTQGFTWFWEMFWGLIPNLPWWVYVIFSLLSLALVVVIHKTPFERIYSFPHLEVLSAFESEQTVIQISHDKTMIAVSRESTQVMDETAFLDKGDDETGITIIKSDDGKYMLQADHEVMVNNKTVISRELEPGDVIKSEGTMIIFDEPGED